MKLVHRSYLALALSLSIFGALSLSGHPAEAATPAAAERRSAVELHLDGDLGVSTAGARVGALALARVGPLEGGASFACSGLFSSRIGGGLALGVGGHRPGGLGFDVLGELGLNQHHVAGNLLSSDPGATGSVPYLGLRAGADWAFGSPDAIAHPTLGLWAFARADLGQSNASYTFTESGWFSGRSESQQGSARLGGGFEAGLALAGGFDLLP
jgi:hypothetical protein